MKKHPKSVLLLGCFLIFLGLLFRDQNGKLQIDLEKIAVCDELELASLQVDQALCDGKTETVAIGASGAVCTNKALHELLGRDIELGAGDVFEGDEAVLAVNGGVQINACAGKGIFADIAEQIIKNAPKQSAVRGEINGFFGNVKHGHKVCISEFFIVFPCRLL